MKKEDKQLLLKDLCARIPYTPSVLLNGKESCLLTGIDGEKVYLNIDSEPFDLSESNIKSYLRPMSSMTEKERVQLYYAIDFYGKIDMDGDIDASDHEFVFSETCIDYIDWLNAHHFDYRGLIENGLAIEAPEDMYKTE